MPPEIVADECVDFRIIRQLRGVGFQVFSILENNRSAKDKGVLEIAREHGALLLTEDKDFGEWIFAHKEPDVGVILLRYHPTEVNKIADSLLQLLNKYETQLLSKFTVIKPGKIRMRTI